MPSRRRRRYADEPAFLLAEEPAEERVGIPCEILSRWLVLQHLGVLPIYARPRAAVAVEDLEALRPAQLLLQDVRVVAVARRVIRHEVPAVLPLVPELQ